MKSLLFFGSLLFCLSGFAQYSEKTFNDVRELNESGAYEELINKKSLWLEMIPLVPDSSAASIYFYIGNSYYQTGLVDSAFNYFEKENSIRTKYKEENYEDYSNSLYNLVLASNELGDYQTSLGTGNELIAGDLAYYGETSEQYISSVIFFLETLTFQGKFLQAKELASATQSTINEKHTLYPALTAHLADIQAALGEYSRAENNFKRAIDLLEDQEEESMSQASAKVNLANMYLSQGRLIEAEEMYLEALTVFKNMGEEGDANYYSSLNNFGLAQLSLSRTEDAIKTYDELIRHDRAVYGSDHPYFATAINNAGTAFSDMGDFSRGLSYLSQYKALANTIYGADSYDYAVALNNLAKTHALSGQPKEAIPLFNEALKFYQATVGENSSEFLTATYNLGWTLMMLKNPEARATLLKALNGRRDLLGKNHPKYGETAFKLAVHEWMIGRNKEAVSYFAETFMNYYSQIDRYFTGLSESEKNKFYYTSLRPAFEIFNSFTVKNHDSSPGLLGDIYNIQLNTKGLVFYATTKVRETIVKSGDAAILQKYENWLSQKEQLTKLYSSSAPEELKLIDSLESATNALEKELTKSSATFEKNLSRKLISWKDVQAKLGKDEAAIEMIRFREYTPDSGGYYTGKVKYAALLLKKEFKKGPDLILFENPSNRMEKQNLSYYRNSIKFEVDDPYSFNIYWEPIAARLKGVRKIYFSPDGVYHQINLNSIKNTSTNKYLIEDVAIEQVTNTKDIIEFKRSKTVGFNNSYLLGFPQYSIKSNATEQTSTRGGTTRGDRGGILRYLRGEQGIALLPGTKEEIAKIESIFNEGNFKPSVLITSQAQEASIKGMNHPSLIHIATHGFFVEDPDFTSAMGSGRYIDNPLLRAGLILAGAEDYLATGNASAENGEDGILTAMEVMNLNFDDTELVVLSACETGLGAIQNGEGVYGLRRAFRTAGAQCLIMSLWNVDDNATQELMTRFYQNLLKTGDKQLAFYQAQLSLKEKYPNPFYWAAFVMIGE